MSALSYDLHPEYGWKYTKSMVFRQFKMMADRRIRDEGRGVLARFPRAAPLVPGVVGFGMEPFPTMRTAWQCHGGVLLDRTVGRIGVKGESKVPVLRAAARIMPWHGAAGGGTRAAPPGRSLLPRLHAQDFLEFLVPLEPSVGQPVLDDQVQRVRDGQE